MPKNVMGYDPPMDVLSMELKKAEAQIKRMKCCGNCDEWNRDKQKCYLDRVTYIGFEVCRYWELAE